MRPTPRAAQAHGPGGCRLEALLCLLAPGDEDALRAAVEEVARWDGVRGATLELDAERSGAERLLVTAGTPLAPRLRRVSLDLIDRAAVIGRLGLAFRDGEAAATLAADCEVAATMLAAAGGRWRTEGALLEAQSYQVAGQIAAGLVHEFNNALTGIAGNAAMAHALAGPGDRIAVPIQRIEDATGAASSIARALLSFVRGSLQRTAVSMNELARDTQRVLAHAVRDGVVVDLDLAASLPWVEGEQALLQQALVNLVLNAEQAIEGDGRVTIRTRATARVPEDVQGCPAAADAYVALSVQDTGPGIGVEALGRVFEPFFTTKGSAGTGLGLASVVQVARRHGGAVGLESRPGEGATFTLYLPAQPVESATDSCPPAVVAVEQT
ncbi:MAG: nitrogen regulation protein NR(II) [Dehalococcoidia bacterium]